LSSPDVASEFREKGKKRKAKRKRERVWKSATMKKKTGKNTMPKSRMRLVRLLV
jgi:hypothetical protein